MHCAHIVRWHYLNKIILLSYMFVFLSLGHCLALTSS
jgi:hypothetical protein